MFLFVQKKKFKIRKGITTALINKITNDKVVIIVIRKGTTTPITTIPAVTGSNCIVIRKESQLENECLTNKLLGSNYSNL
jgi:hypothetical protein